MRAENSAWLGVPCAVPNFMHCENNSYNQFKVSCVHSYFLARYIMNIASDYIMVGTMNATSSVGPLIPP